MLKLDLWSKKNIEGYLYSRKSFICLHNPFSSGNRSKLFSKECGTRSASPAMLQGEGAVWNLLKFLSDNFGFFFFQAFLFVFLLATDRRFLQATQSCDGNFPGLLGISCFIIDLFFRPGRLTIRPADFNCLRWWETAGLLIFTMAERLITHSSQWQATKKVRIRLPSPSCLKISATVWKFSTLGIYSAHAR